MDAARLRELLVLANPFKEGDLLVGGTRDDRVRAEARAALGAVTLGEIRRTPIVDDGVTAALAHSAPNGSRSAVDQLTVRDFKSRLLGPNTSAWVDEVRGALTGEAIAAVTKLMSDDELSRVACALFNPLPGEGIRIGASAHFGSRIQPNSPGDTDEEILFSILEGLAHGCGDVIVGLNPASDELETIIRLEDLLRSVVERLELPTRYCVLSDLPKQHAARAHARVDVGFQSLAGTSRALNGMVGLDIDGLIDLAHSFDALYFETGQGSAVTNGVAEGVDMVTLESRAYGVARHLRAQTGAWMIVNDVAGFIGPEVFRTPEQLERTCLEDTVMAKLHGITMGLDVCATFHMGIAPAVLQQVTERIVERAAPAYLMAVAGNADPMLGYLTTSFREHPRLRQRTRRQIGSAMHRRLQAIGLMNDRQEVHPNPVAIASLYARYAKAGGDRRSTDALADEGLGTLNRLRERGFDLGFDVGAVDAAPAAVQQRLDAIYSNARLALYAKVDEGVIREASLKPLRVRTLSADREEYLARPASGERIAPRDLDKLAQLYSSRRPPQVQIVVSDGLNANAINAHLRVLLPPLRQTLVQSSVHVGDIDVVVENGRVRAGYHAAQAIDPEAVIHIIGERPGTGLDTASAYLTYGRDAAGRSRWSPDLDHSCTTAVCGIHAKGKPPDVAVSEICRTVTRMLEAKQSGVRTTPRVLPESM